MKHTCLNEENAMKITYFTHVRSKVCESMSLTQFIERTRNGTWQRITEEYRQALADGNEQRATRLKGNLPAIAPAGIFEGGHSAANLVQLSGLVDIDIDKCSERIEEIRELLHQLPYVVYTQISPSNNGVKCLARVSISQASQYTPLFRLITTHISNHIQFPCDMQCSDVSRLQFVCHDPTVYYRPDAITFQEHLDLEGKLPVEFPEPPPATPVLTDATALPGKGTALAVLEEVLREIPFLRGHRNECMLRLGQRIRVKDFSHEEVEKMISLAGEKLAQPDFPEEEIRRTLLSGYQYVSRKKATDEKEENNQFLFNPTGANTFVGGSGAEEYDLSDNTNRLRNEAPYIPDEVYEQLPPLLQEVVKDARNPRERDIMLMAAISNLSIIIPHVKLSYAGSLHGTQLFFAVIAPAGAGKGCAFKVSAIVNDTHNHYEKIYQMNLREHQTQMQVWETDREVAVRKGNFKDLPPKPEPPKGIYLNIAANTSKSRMVEHLCNNGPLGAVMNCAEIDTLSSSSSQEYGKFDDLLRCCFDGDRYVSSFKISNEPICVEEPRMAHCLAGTPDQFVRFIGTLENGLYSRFMLLTTGNTDEWLSAAPRENVEDSSLHFARISKEVFEAHLTLTKSPTLVKFTIEQWGTHDGFFSDKLKEVREQENDNIDAIVKRAGVMVCRMAAIFTALRKYDDYLLLPERICEDRDFNNAMRIIATTLEHSLLLSSSFPENTRKKAQALTPFNKMVNILNLLPSSYKYADFVAAGASLGIAGSTCIRLAKNSITYGKAYKKDKLYWKAEEGGTE